MWRILRADIKEQTMQASDFEFAVTDCGEEGIVACIQPRGFFAEHGCVDDTALDERDEAQQAVLEPIVNALNLDEVGENEFLVKEEGITAEGLRLSMSAKGLIHEPAIEKFIADCWADCWGKQEAAQ